MHLKKEHNNIPVTRTPTRPTSTYMESPIAMHFDISFYFQQAVLPHILVNDFWTYSAKYGQDILIKCFEIKKKKLISQGQCIKTGQKTESSNVAYLHLLEQISKFPLAASQ